MLCDYDKIVKNLKLLQTDQVKVAEAKLKSQSQSGVPFLVALYNVLISRNIDQWVKMSASSFLNSTICSNISEFEQSYCTNMVLQIINNSQVNILSKKILERTIVILLQGSEIQQLVVWQKNALNLINSDNFYLKQIGIFLSYCFGVAEIDDKYFSQFVIKFYEMSIKHCMQIGFEQNQIEILKQFFKAWTLIINRLFQKQNNQFQLARNYILNSKLTYQIIDYIYHAQSTIQCFICINQYCEDYNSLKYNGAQFHQAVLKYSEQYKNQNGLKHLLGVFDKIVKTATTICMNISSLQRWNCQDYITSLLSIMTIFYNIYGDNIGLSNWQHIHEYIIYPLLVATQYERVDFEQQFECFNSLAEDCCDKQQMKVFKTQAAKLLKAIGETHTDSIQYAINRALQSIKIGLGFIKQNNSTKVLDLQTSFLFLSIFYQQLAEDKQKIKTLRIILCDPRILQLPPFETSRIFFLLAYNFGEIFPQPQDGGHLINYALQYTKHNTTFLTGLQFVSSVCGNYYNEEFVSIIVNTIKECQQSIIYVIINRIIDSNGDKMSNEIFIKMIMTIFNKIESECIRIKELQRRQTHFIVLSLHILNKIICKINVLMSKNNKNYADVKQVLWKICNFFDEAVKYNIEDEIIKIINGFLVKQTIINQVFINLLPKIIDLFHNDKYLRTPYFIFFNQFISKSNTDQIFPVLNVIVTGLTYHASDLNDKLQTTLQKISVANHLLILQNIIAIHGTKISQQQQSQICTMCIKFLPQPSKDHIEPIIMARVLNILLISYMHWNNTKCIQYILKFHDENIYKGYDTKVLLQCIGKQIFRQNDLVMISELINIMVRVFKQSNQFSPGQTVNRKHNKKQSTKIRIRRHNDYQGILKNLTTPFNKQLNEVKLIKQIMNTMKSNNIEKYQNIIKSLPSDVSKELKQIHELQIIVKEKKTIHKVQGMKRKSNALMNLKVQKRLLEDIEHSVLSSDGEDSQIYKSKQVKKRRNLN